LPLTEQLCSYETAQKITPAGELHLPAELVTPDSAVGNTLSAFDFGHVLEYTGAGKNKHRSTKGHC